MFKGQLIFVKHDHRTGTSQKTQQPYEIANVTLSDGLESFELNFDPRLLNDMKALGRGQKANFTLTIEQQFNRTVPIVTNVEVIK